MPFEDFIRKIPKAELHMHLEGSIEPEMMLALAARNNIALRWRDAQALRNAYTFVNLEDFLALYFECCKVLVTEQDFHDITKGYLQRCATDNVIHAEMFIGPQTFLQQGVDIDTLMRGVLSAMRDAQRESGVHSGLIISVHRHRSEADALAVLDCIEPWRDQVAGIGMGGPEVGNPPSRFARFFAECRRRGYMTTVHAGEEGPAEYVRQSIELLRPDRIDHGVSAIHDPDLMRLLRERNIPLTLCPLSNVRLNVVASMADHPLRRMLDEGLFVTVNSDNPPYFGGYVNENLIAAQQGLQLDVEAIVQLAKNSLQALFIRDSTKSRYLQKLSQFVALRNVAPS
ncbi:adenosine deaminase (plasmid) [Sphingobium fuliginis ATCC 27551]|uniref:Adenine deaminase n=2 Tax=Sphingobium fuliginis (strain ATCC 27551) TaxID=336203 RepID=A0A5B8CNZ7_SPHSA|nr:adenosine deaminase [Sphingobium fuliginis ATCC 27551]